MKICPLLLICRGQFLFYIIGNYAEIGLYKSLPLASAIGEGGPSLTVDEVFFRNNAKIKITI
jgi:hypothetical protein